MASAQAQIEIAIKNVRALDNLSRKLNQLILVNKKLVTSINKLDTTFKKISKSGLNNLEQGAKKASKGVLTTTDSIEALTGRLKGLKREGGAALDLVGNRFKTIGKGITLQPFKGLIDEISKVPYVVKRSFQDTRTFLEILSKGGKDIVGLVSGLGALIVNVKNLGVAARTNLTSLGTILDNNANKAENFLNKMVLGIKMQNTAFALAKNTALAQQKSLPGTLLRNTLRSQAGRAGTGFGDFSQGIGEYNPYQIATPTPRYGAGRIGPIHPTQHYALQSNPYMGRFDNAIQKSIARHTKHLAKISKATSKTASILTKQTAMDSLMPTGYLPGGIGQYSQPIGPQLPLANRLGFGKKADPKGIFASRQGKTGRVRGAISSGLIGGGFPALFGQSPLASLFGGVGGVAGGALGGGFGFGLSIAGTAIAQRIQETIDFRKSIKDLNIDMKAMGFNAGFNAKEIIKLGKSLGITKQEAVQVAAEFKRFGKQGALFAQAFGGDYGAFTALAQATEVESAMAAIKAINKDLSLEEELRYILALRTLGVEKTIDQILQKQLEKQQQKVRDKFDISDSSQPLRPGYLNRRAKALREEEERIQKTIDGFKQTQEQFKKIQLAAEASSRSIVTGLEDINRELRKLNDPQFQIVEGAKAISEAFSTSFKGIISGTMSVQQAFANMFQRIADHFLDMAAQMAATQLQKGILSMFANSFTVGFNSSALSGSTLPTDVGGLSFKDAMNMGTSYFASGGYVTRPTVGLVGEAGEDEYVIPASKMASSMQRYSAGARGEAVIAGGGSSYSSGGTGGSTTVNYSGPILNFNSEEFVPKSAVGQIIATATARGAKAGEARTLSSLQNSRSRRSNLGL